MEMFTTNHVTRGAAVGTAIGLVLGGYLTAHEAFKPAVFTNAKHHEIKTWHGLPLCGEYIKKGVDLDDNCYLPAYEDEPAAIVWHGQYFEQQVTE